MQIKQHAKVNYSGCLIHVTLSGELMALNVINKINNMLKFLCRKNNFLTPALRCLLCNALLIQPPFDYACSTWHPVLTRKLKQNSHFAN